MNYNEKKKNSIKLSAQIKNLLCNGNSKEKYMSRIVEVLEMLSDSDGLFSEEVAANLGITHANSRTILYDMRHRKMANRKGKWGERVWRITQGGEKFLAMHKRQRLAKEKIKKRGKIKKLTNG